jgi:hypothetical protein
VLGAVALAMVAHLFEWELPDGIAVAGCLFTSGELGRDYNITRASLQRAAETGGIRRVFMDRGAPIAGATRDPRQVVRVHRFPELCDLVWAPPPPLPAAKE